MRTIDSLIEPHIASFDSLFTESILTTLISKIEPITLIEGENTVRVYVEDINVYKSFVNEKEYDRVDRRLKPAECRERMQTYRGKIVIRIGCGLNGEHVYSEEKSGGHMPIMIGSVLCHEKGRETGGYFIVNGLEKMFRFLIAQKRNFVFAQKKVNYEKRGLNFSCNAVMARCVGRDEISHVIYLHYSIDGRVYLRYYEGKRERIETLAPILRRFSGKKDKEIFKEILNGFFENKNLENKKIVLEEKIRLFLRKDSQIAAEKLSLKLHVEESKKKYLFLIFALKKLLRLELGEIVADDPDNSMNHEVLGISQLISVIGVRFVFEKKPFSLTRQTIPNLFKRVDISVGNRIEALLATGSCATAGHPDILQTSGFVVAAERINFYRFLSHFRCVNRGTYFTKVKVTGVRKLRPESFGFLCPVHTPDGTPCGILNHLSVDATIIFKNEEIPISEFFLNGMVEFNAEIPVFVEGIPVGFVLQRNASNFAQSLRNYRSKNNLKVEIVESVNHEFVDPGIFIFGGPGRFSRPVKKEEFFDSIGIMEQVYIEFENKSNGYAEISKVSFLSLLAGLTPYSDHNQSPRNMYQCQMAKQSMGITYYDLKKRTDNKSYQLVYAQSPIVRTSFYNEFIELDSFPIGINAIVAVLSYTCYDMEDAMVINKSGIERGFFNNFVYKTEVIRIEKNSTLLHTADVGTRISPDSTLVTFIENNNESKTIRYKGFDEGVVDSVRVFCDPLLSNEINTILLKIRIERNPSIGDKFCSRHGQKGVCSMKYPQIDLPFSESGLIPDIIINPHAFPSRMTVGMLIESLAAKSGCIRAEFKDGSAFQTLNSDSLKNVEKFENKFLNSNSLENAENLSLKIDHPKKFGDELVKAGFNYYGNEPMYSGTYGNCFDTDIFIGVVYYQRLRHMVNDKYQVRTHGAVMPQTKQPIKGRSKLGGVRLGEMERDAILGHGAAYLLQDRLVDCSDSSEFFYCSVCCSVLFAKINGCCNAEVVMVKIPYVFKYLCAELLAMCVKVKVVFE